MKVQTQTAPDVRDVVEASTILKDVVLKTPLMENINLSDRYEANILLKREDLQVVRSYKIRGAFNKISSLSEDEQQNGVVCASAGNHAQGVAYACFKLGIQGKIYMPNTTPGQKVSQVRSYGKDKVEVVLTGDTFDDAYAAADQWLDKVGLSGEIDTFIKDLPSRSTKDINDALCKGEASMIFSE